MVSGKAKAVGTELKRGHFLSLRMASRGCWTVEPQEPPEARGIGLGWGWCMAGKRSRTGKGKNKTLHFGGLWTQSPRQEGQVETLLIRKSRPSLATSLIPMKGGVGLGQAGVLLNHAPLPPNSSPCSIPEHVQPAQGLSPVYSDSLSHSCWLRQLSEVTVLTKRAVE